MQTTKKPQNGSNLTTHVTVGTKLNGRLETNDNVRIDGEFIGDVKVTGKLVLGENAFVSGDISAIDVVIGGRVEGNVKGIWSVTLQSTGNLTGDLNTEELTIERGACFQGACQMINEEEVEEEVLALKEA